MPLYQVIILAVVQGITEFLPVSSTAHLEIFQTFLGWHFTKEEYDFSFDVALHAGTLLALLIYFYRDGLQISAHGIGRRYGHDHQLKQNSRLLWLLVIATIPVGIAGLVFGKHAEGNWRSPYVIATMLIVVGVLMWVAEHFAICRKDMGQISGTDAGWIGLSQALAIVPGTSRSGITMTTGLFRDLDRPTAARFSFLLSTPAIAAAAAKAYWDLHKHHGGLPADMRVAFIVGIIGSALVGIFVIAFLLDYLRRHSLKVFAYYRIIFGIIVFALAYLFRAYAG